MFYDEGGGGVSVVLKISVQVVGECAVRNVGS